jgi:hypothetical protein
LGKVFFNLMPGTAIRERLQALAGIPWISGTSFSKRYLKKIGLVYMRACRQMLEMLSPSIHKFGNEFIPSGLSAALGHELGPNGVSMVLTEYLPVYVTIIANRST